MLRVRVENRSWSKQQRLSPLRQVWNVSRKTHHTFVKSGNRKKSYGIVRRCVFELPTRLDRIFQNSFDVLYIDPEPNLQFRTRMIGNDVWSCAATDHSDVARRRAKETVFGPMTTANIVENIKQLFDRRLA